MDGCGRGISCGLSSGQRTILGKEGRLDIRAEKQFSGYYTILAVECKKADPGYKDLVFFPKERGEVKAAVVDPKGEGRRRPVGDRAGSLGDSERNYSFHDGSDLSRRQRTKGGAWQP